MKISLTLLSLACASLVKAYNEVPSTTHIGGYNDLTEYSERMTLYDQELSDTSSNEWRLVFHVKRPIKNAIFSRYGQDFEIVIENQDSENVKAELGFFPDRALSYGKAVKCFNRYYCEAPQLEKYTKAAEAPRGARKLSKDVKAVGIMHDVTIWDRFLDNFRIRKPVRAITYVLWVKNVGYPKTLKFIQVREIKAEVFSGFAKVYDSQLIKPFAAKASVDSDDVIALSEEDLDKSNLIHAFKVEHPVELVESTAPADPILTNEIEEQYNIHDTLQSKEDDDADDTLQSKEDDDADDQNPWLVEPVDGTQEAAVETEMGANKNRKKMITQAAKNQCERVIKSIKSACKQGTGRCDNYLNNIQNSLAKCFKPKVKESN